MPELGATGQARVLGIYPCPAIQEGPGQVVTATFAHPATHQILNVTIGADPNVETIGVTETHPFWSVNHNAFVPIGQLSVGDEVLTLHGQTKRIETLLPRPGPSERVYNLEVNGEHTYFVGQQQLLVHNACADKLRDAMNRAGTFGDSGTVPHHMVSRFDRRAADARKILDKYKIDLDSHWNGVFLPTRGSKARGAIHNNLHSDANYDTLTSRLLSADAQGRAHVIRELQRIRSELLDGTFSSLLNRNINF